MYNNSYDYLEIEKQSNSLSSTFSDKCEHKPRYIDAENIEFFASSPWKAIATKSSIDNIPTADVAEVKHGEWVKDETAKRADGAIYDYCCSECKNPANKDNYGNRTVFTFYCPNCGAKMDLNKE